MLLISRAPGYQEVLAFVCHPPAVPATGLDVASRAPAASPCIGGLLLARCNFASAPKQPNAPLQQSLFDIYQP
ncbi:MAG TPA: hypothetical protein VFB88_15575, partial [Xanthobacteraceae bacterium]|nr:hypothetical protein [Xanthobacteraceae bacterium]